MFGSPRRVPVGFAEELAPGENGPTLSRQQARSVVESIRTENGGITPADRAKTPKNVLEALESVRKKFGAAVNRLSTDLYSTKTRFVYELIQNAEDNQYTKAAMAEQDPFLTFTLHPSKLVIDSNEDGFNEANVKAICSTSQSTKTNAQGYIGEKGIGFKSVFKVASKVHIQSEPFSFAFEHKFGDSGLGMVTPLLDEFEELPSGIRSRISLTLSPSSDFAELVKDFEDLPDSLLIFLSTLKSITINVMNASNELVSKTVYAYQYSSDNHRGTLTKRRSIEGKNNQIAQHFHITKRSLKKLPTDAARPKTDQAEVVLAFPLDEKSLPIIEQQHVFAYLPVRKVGFNFQIQSDFITQASREDIVHSPRNLAIRDGVAEAFRDAVVQFCQQPNDLRFEWIKYLPGATISDTFWANLLWRIIAHLQGAPILLSRSGRCWKLPSQLKWVPPSCEDEHGVPLFDDLLDELYLSRFYKSGDKSTLGTLGVKGLTMEDMLPRITADLLSLKSRYKSSTTGESWHTRTAELLIRPFEKDQLIKNKLRSLPLMPLITGEYVSISVQPSALVFGTIPCNEIYYPYSETGVPVPTDIGLSLLHAKAYMNASRKALFSKLGVTYCDPGRVIQCITNCYSKWNNVNLMFSMAHMRYLYWHLPEGEKSLDVRIYLKDQAYVAVYRKFVTLGKADLIVDDIYLETEQDYGVKSLLEQVTDGQKIIAPSFPVHFINKAYLDAVPPEARRFNLSWKEWLKTVAGVRSVPRLVDSKDPLKLSRIFQHIVRHQPTKLVGTLKTYWTDYQHLMQEEIVKALSEAKVRCENVGDTPLWETYLPTAQLKQRTSDLGLSHTVPFIKLPYALTHDLADWQFLKLFHVGYEADLGFYLDALHFFDSDRMGGKEVQSLLDVYSEIERHSKVDEYDRVRKVFDDGMHVYTPSKTSEEAVWGSSQDCLWHAPEFIDLWYPLATSTLYNGNKRFERLFRTILGVEDATWSHCVDQLREEKRRAENHTDVSNIYSYIWNEVRRCKSKLPELREQFENDHLIYHPQLRTWYPPSLCLWTSNTRTSGKVSLAHYRDLEDFFVQYLEVREPDINIYIEELKFLGAGNKNPSVEIVKELIQYVNSMGPRQESLQELQSCPILPVKDLNGQVTLRRPSDAFAISDRHDYEYMFDGKVPILDYTKEEAHELQPFLSALTLANRYMSLIVKEISTVNVALRHPRLTHSIRDKSYAIFRCAVHYRAASARDDALYRRFRELDVFESDGITKTITLSLDGIEPVTVEGASAKLHIEESDNRLQLYVPRDSTERELCFLKGLPEGLAACLGIKEIKAVKVLGDILKATSAVVISELLEEHGIDRLPWPDPVQHSVSSNETQANDDLTPEPSSHPRSSTPVQRPRSPRPTSTPRTSFSSQIESPYNSDTYLPGSPSFLGSAHTPRSSLSPAPTPVQVESVRRHSISNDEYISLLSFVIAAAAKGDIPEPIKYSDALFGKRSENQMAHDIKIGAAGELYAFECLLNLDLPNFGRANWKSNVRKKVCVHEKYRDMEDWTGPETADIVYEDEGPEFVLTKSFSEYLPMDRLKEGAPIKYYLEVKTTTEDCSSRFFVSKAQYRRMHRMTLDPENPASEVYVILRVFNLGRRDMDMRIYVDPATMKREKKLIFQAESYSVSVGTAH